MAHVLVVDDDKDQREGYAEVLRSYGFDATTAAGGAIALRLLRENPGMFPLVLSDTEMPIMTGIELAENLLQDGPHPVFVLMSAKTITGDVGAPFRARIADLMHRGIIHGFHPKLTETDELVRLIEELLAHTTTQPTV